MVLVAAIAHGRLWHSPDELISVEDVRLLGSSGSAPSPLKMTRLTHLDLSATNFAVLHNRPV